MECDGVGIKKEMVAGLQSRREALESKLREKNNELKALCIQEAELTGVLPPETPVEPGESPPSFRRRVGTAFTYPENLINKLKSKEEESFAALELECKIQNGIAEAALGLASDGTASKSVRRKHRLMYQQSQRRLMELETRLSFMRQSSITSNINNNNNIVSNNNSAINNYNKNGDCGISTSSNLIGNSTGGKCQLKQRKKPRPPLDSDGDCCDGLEIGTSNEHLLRHHQPLSFTVSDRSASVLRHSHTYNGAHPVHRQVVRNHVNPYTWQYQASTSPDIRSLAHNEPEPGWYHTAPNPSRTHHVSTNEDERPVSHLKYKDRFGSLDRRRSGTGWLNEDGSEDRDRHAKPSIADCVPAVLLPNQTYPENSLMRTLSLGLVDHTAVRKSRVKEWYETALDGSAGSPPLQALTASPSPLPLLPAHQNTELHIEAAVEHRSGSSQVSFDTVVPFESPKNHTVVEAGKWQPYREVTKPFEMADFYKYSTKFRKNNSNNNNNLNNAINGTGNNDNSGSNSPQHKGVYLPLQPMTCQPLLQNSPLPPGITSKDRRELENLNNSNGQHLSQSPDVTMAPSSSLAEAFSNEMLAWYQDKNVTHSRSATLV